MNLKNQKTLSLAFKGTRDYLRSSDIYNEILSTIGSYDSIEMHFAKKMTHKIVAIPLTEISPNDKKRYSGFVTFSKHSEQSILGLLEDKTSPVTTRIPYDETSMRERLFLEKDKKLVHIEATSAFSPFDHLVFANKYLLESLFEEKAKWALTKIHLHETLQPGALTIHFTHKLGARLVKSDIYHNSKMIGKVYFSDFKGE